MHISRRQLLAQLSGVAATAAASRSLPAFEGRPLDEESIPWARPGKHSIDFPRKQDFEIAEGYTYINGAYTHPMPRAAADAFRAVVERRGRLAPPPDAPRGVAAPSTDPRAAFARLINAKPSEIGWIPNTSTGENLVIEGLGLHGPFDGNIVTDELHFEGALIHLLELKRQGVDVRVAKQKDGRVDIEDLARLVDRKTRLVEISWVSMYNGFQHDLAAVCELAHTHGAYVYADIIQGVGAVPLDVRATGLDFAASATYKWLVGDFGLAFFFVREDLLGRVFQRPHWSYRSAPDADIHLSPYDPQSANAVTYTPGRDAASYVELGTVASGVAAALGVAIPYIAELDVERIQQHRLPLLRALQRELPRLGFTPQTPVDSTSPIVTFAIKNSAGVAEKLARARVNVRVAPTWIRIAPSVYNDLSDIERLIDALS